MYPSHNEVNWQYLELNRVLLYKSKIIYTQKFYTTE